MELQNGATVHLLCTNNDNISRKMRTKKQMTIGQRIKEVFDNMPKSCTVNWFAAQLHCDRRNIYRIFERENIDILLLERISRVLDHDFFADLSKSYLSDVLSSSDTMCDL